MKNRQKAKLTMYRAVETHCNDNASLIATIPAFHAAFNEFKAKIAEILNRSRNKYNNQNRFIGRIPYKTAPPSKYTIRITATGFQDFEQDDVEVKLGAVNKFDVEIENS